MGGGAHRDTFVRDRLPSVEAQPLFLREPPYAYPQRLNCGVLLDRAAEATPEAPAILYGELQWSYAELAATANRIAGVLADDPDWRPGARVLLHGPNTPWCAAAWFGIVKAGGVVVATMPLLRAAELAKVVAKAEIDWALGHNAFAEAVEGAAGLTGRLAHRWWFGPGGDLKEQARAMPATFASVDTAADDPVLIAFTSGTTGEPKGCVHDHRDVMAMADGFCAQVLRPGAEEVFCGTPPLAFTFGLGALLVFPASVGASVAYPERPGWEVLCETIARHRVTTLFTAPTGYRALMKLADDHDLSSLRKCVSAGEPLPAATSHAWFERTGIRIIDGIGATEMIHIFVSETPERQRPGATGRPVPGYVAEVQDEDGSALPDGEVGRLAVRGPTGCRYLADERQAAYVKRGWNLTGDLYTRDADGYFHFVSRADDLILSAGYNIAAPEVENALLSHPAVAEVAVTGLPDEERGQVCAAFVVLKGEATAAELQSHVKGTIAPYKYPRRVTFVEALPKTPTGKLQRFRLKELA